MKTKKNILFSLVLCAALILGSVVNPMITEATAQATTSETYDVSEYRSGSTYTYPEKMGYIFAGWYTDNTYATALGADVKEGTAYAKFIDEDILGVRCQILSDTTVDDGETIMRIVTGIDDGDYAKIGFKFKFDSGAEFTYATTDVYTSIYGYVDENSTEYVPADVFEGASYFAGVDISAFTKNYFDDSLTITALLRTQDGTTVEGKMKRMSVVDGVNVYAGNVAKIGEQYYADFASALSAATSGATIELIKDAGYTNSTGNTLYLTKTIVVNGNGNQFNLTANGNYAVFEINDSEIDLTIKNADVVHGTKGMILRYKDSITTDKDTTGEGVLTLDNVNITSASSYQWCLFNLAQKAGTTRADFDNVDITWNGTHASTGSIIRTGNDLTNTRTVFADFNNCNFDTSGCTASNYLLYCATGTTTNVTLNNTFIDDKASYAINGESAAKTINSVSVKAWDTLNVACENIELASGEQLLNSKVAKTEVTDAEGNTTCTWYTDFSTAMDATKNAVGDVTLMMYQDSVHNPSSAYNIPDVEFEDKDLVIDGNDFTLTTQGSNNSFVVKQTDGSFTLKNMYIEHDSTAILARTDTAAKLYFEDLVVNADNYTEPVEGETADNTVYRYGLFNALNSYDTEMYFKNVDITLDVSNTPVSTDAPAVIRTGNTGDEKTVSIYLDGCNIDATRANTRAGIRVMNKTTANIYLKDTSILVQNNYSIYSYKNTEAYEKTINIYGDNVLLKRNDVPTDPSRGYIFTVNDNLDVSTWPLQ